MSTALQQIRQTATQKAFQALNRAVLPVVKAGLGSPLPIGLGLVVLETTGRVSGRTREVPLVATRCGRSVSVSTVRSSSQWTRNVAADSDVAVWVGGRRRPGTGHVDPGPLTRTSIELTD